MEVLASAQQDATGMGKLIHDVETALDSLEVQESDVDYRMLRACVASSRARLESYAELVARMRQRVESKNVDVIQNSAWYLQPSNEFFAGSNIDRDATPVTAEFREVIRDAPGTTWARIAQREIETPLGWKWQESFAPDSELVATAQVTSVDIGSGQSNLAPDSPLADKTAEYLSKRLRTQIHSADWEGMADSLKSSTRSTMSADEKRKLQPLLELADLATYYREGIRRAVDTLAIGNDFAITDSFRVIVVDKGADLLVVRYNQKNRSFSFDEFPFSLANRLAELTIPPGPTLDASKAVYNAIAPKATESHRKASVAQLRAIGDEVNGVSVPRVANTIEQLYLNGD